ncbi:DUF883 family protein [Horticoccus sp. 23ND18S-11]|uniref:DUF883 family protein n=1 Tax=Horticoccus sp. 23ND18S-11 TaxID=3391832 RepID=UPI0039C9E4F9
METHFPTSAHTESQQARERVMADLKTLVRDSEDLLKATAGDMSEAARDARARIGTALERARATYSEMQAQGIESAKQAMKKADDTIRTHPYQSIGIAFGVGLLLGVLLKRK